MQFIRARVSFHLGRSMKLNILLLWKRQSGQLSPLLSTERNRFLGRLEQEGNTESRDRTVELLTFSRSNDRRPDFYTKDTAFYTNKAFPKHTLCFYISFQFMCRLRNRGATSSSVYKFLILTRHSTRYGLKMVSAFWFGDLYSN